MSNTEDDAKTVIPSTIPAHGKLVFPDKKEITIDNAKRFVGRADLKKYTKSDPNDISRFEFIIYKKGENFFKKTKEKELQLENDQEIQVSDVKMQFKV